MSRDLAEIEFMVGKLLSVRDMELHPNADLLCEDVARYVLEIEGYIKNRFIEIIGKDEVPPEDYALGDEGRKRRARNQLRRQLRKAVREMEL